MQKPLLNRVEQHLDTYYWTLKMLAEHANVSPEQITELIGAQCIPPHSYEVRQIYSIIDPLTDYSETKHVVRYYHPSLVDWIHQANKLVKEFS